MFRLYRNEEFVMDYNGPRKEENFINFIKSINEEGSAAITKLSDIQKLVDNSTDKFFVSFAHKVPYALIIMICLMFLSTNVLQGVFETPQSIQ